MNPKTPDAHSGVLDINAVFRSGGRAVEFLEQINKASLVMLCEAGIVPREHGTAIARGIVKVGEDARAEFERTGVPRHSADYLDYEPRQVAAVGPDASRLHSGRSRQDLASTIARMNLRDGLTLEVEELITAREKALGLRAQSSLMLGDMHTVFLVSHNARAGMFDYRMYDPVPCGRPLQVLQLLQQVLGALVVDKDRALAEVASALIVVTAQAAGHATKS